MRRFQKAFTLIELMIVVAIVGILAAIALPAYLDYAIRSKMSEAEGTIAACKTSVSEFLSSRASMPSTAVEAGCGTLASTYVASLTVTNGVIGAITHNTGASPECTLTLTPTTNGLAVTTWTGSYAACAAKYVPSAFR